MQATARMASVVSSTHPARRRLIRSVRHKKMNFSKSDKLFELASIDPTERRALIKKLKKIRRNSLWTFWISVLSLAIVEVWHNSQRAPIRGGEFPSFSPHSSWILFSTYSSWMTFLISLGAWTFLIAVHTDHRVKMLTLFNNLERSLTHKNPAEHVEGGKASSATS